MRGSNLSKGTLWKPRTPPPEGESTLTNSFSPTPRVAKRVHFSTEDVYIPQQEPKRVTAVAPAPPLPAREHARLLTKDTVILQRKPTGSTGVDPTPTKPAPYRGRPFGLPKRTTLEEYRRDPVLRLGRYNYKVACTLGRTKDDLHPVLTVLDSGAGPNLIARGVLPDLSDEEIDSSKEIVRLNDANGRPLRTRGLIRLSIRLGNYCARIPFVVVDRLSTDAILGCDFLDNHVRALMPRKRIVVLPDGSTVRIHRRPAVSCP